MIEVLLWTFGALIAAMVILTGTPLVLRLSAATAPETRVRVGAAPLGGLLPAFTVYDSARPRGARPGPKRPRARRKRPRPARAGGGARAGPALLRLLPDLLGRVHFRRLRVEGTYGFADPADTGALYGAIAAVAPLLGAGPLVNLDLRPDFAGAGVTGRIEAEARLVPAAMLPPVARFVWRAWGPGR